MFDHDLPDKPINTQKPAETRMGKGKGNPEGWVVLQAWPYHVLRSMVDEETARDALRLAITAAHHASKIVKREAEGGRRVNESSRDRESFR